MQSYILHAVNTTIMQYAAVSRSLRKVPGVEHMASSTRALVQAYSNLFDMICSVTGGQARSH